MKQLTDEQRSNLTDEITQEIISDFGKHMRNAQPMYSFESELPWGKTDILFSLLSTLINKSNIDRQTKSAIFEGVLWLFDVLPDPKEYKKRLAAGKKIKKVHKSLRDGLTVEEILAKYNKK